jgi:hypothetical protein
VQNFISNNLEGPSNSVGTCKLPTDGIDDAKTYLFIYLLFTFQGLFGINPLDIGIVKRK